MKGIRVVPEAKERDRQSFAFMSNDISSERQVETAVQQTVAIMRQAREEGKGIVAVAGPVVIHTGGGVSLSKLIRGGWVQAVLAGNALAVHDIESSLFGTSLGVRVSDGRQEEHGHRNHMRAINAIYRAGDIAKAVESGRLTRGVMYECVKAGVPFVLAGSLRDDGPLPDCITDMNEAQDAYAEQLKDAGVVLCLSSMLHSIAVGNMLPAWVKVVCVDINPAVPTKVSDRGTGHAVGVVTDVGLFLEFGAAAMWTPGACGNEPSVSGRTRSSRPSPVASASSAAVRTDPAAHWPPTNPSMDPSASTIARSPARAELGSWARTTVACTNATRDRVSWSMRSDSWVVIRSW